MKEIIKPGKAKYHGHCGECGAEFTYERSDVHHNFVHGGEHVSCPICGHNVRHFGESGTRWPSDHGCDGGSGRWSVS